MKAKKFDEGKDISRYLDISKAIRHRTKAEKGECRFPFMDDSIIG